MTDEIPNELIEAARAYEALFVPALFRQWPPMVLDRAGAGQRLLDVACGTGVLAREAAGHVGSNGSVVGVDAGPGMLAVARELHAGVDWRLGDAAALPVPTASMDRVFCQFGLMFFDDRLAAAKEMARVLVDDGGVAVVVWDSLENNPAYGELVALLERTVGVAAAEATSVPFSLGEVDAVTGLLAEAGFVDVSSTGLAGTADFPSLASMVEAELRGWLPVCDIHLDEALIAAVLDEAQGVLASLVTSDGRARFPVAAHLVTGRKPA